MDFSWFTKLREVIFSFLLSTFGGQIISFLGFFMTGLLGLGESRDEFFMTLSDAVVHANEQKYPDGTEYTNDDKRRYVDSVLEVWMKDHGYAMSMSFVHAAIAIACGNLSPLAQGAGNAVEQALGDEAGAAAAGFLEEHLK